jgi:hypothetical protein
MPSTFMILKGNKAGGRGNLKKIVFFILKKDFVDSLFIISNQRGL